MTPRLAAWLAWSIWAATVACLFGGLILFQLANDRAGLVDQLFFGLAFLAFPTVGALIAARHPRNPLGWIFCAVALVFLGAFAQAYGNYALVVQPGSLPGGVWMAWLGTWVGNPGFYLVFTFALLLFPTGTLLSPRWRPVAGIAAGWILVNAVGTALTPGPVIAQKPALLNPLGVKGLAGLAGLLQTLEGPIILTLGLLSFVSILLRARRARAPERQQFKWFAYAAGLLMVVSVFLTTLDLFVAESPARRLAGDGLFALAVAALPISIGFAILRYRLFDIDLLIRRTLVYSVLSAALASAYFGSVVLLESALRVLTGAGQSQLVTVLSTLAIAALAAPLRRRVQAFIDRRFYRKKYDAARTLAGFAATARDETDLGVLTGRLAEVVRETIQPESVSVWLRPVDGVSKGQKQVEQAGRAGPRP